MSENTETAIVAQPVEESRALTTSQGFVNTCDISTRQGKLTVIKAVNNAQSLADVPEGTVIDVCDIVTKPGIRKARDPRLPNTPCINTYLIDTEGNAYMSQSDGIAQSAEFIVSAFSDMGKSDPEGCVPLFVKVTPLPNGNTVKSLVPAE